MPKITKCLDSLPDKSVALKQALARAHTIINPLCLYICNGYA